MKKLLMLLVVVMLSGPALARDMIDEETHDYTPYGLAIALVAGAQVIEMRCNKKGQIDLAIAKAQRMGVPIDVNDKEDFAAVLFQAVDILKRLNKEGVTSWCKKHSALIEQLLKEP